MPQLCFLEVDPLGDRQALEMAAETIEAHLDGAESHPIAPTDDPSPARHRLALGGNADADRATELDTVRALVEIDQDRKRMAGAGRRAQRTCRGLRGLLRDLGKGRRKTDSRAELDKIPRCRAAAEYGLGAGERRQARGDL